MPKTIVIAWTTVAMEIVRERRTDLGERPELREVNVPRACVWLNEGGPADVMKAHAYAATLDGPLRLVFAYETSEPDPIARAKRDILASLP